MRTLLLALLLISCGTDESSETSSTDTVFQNGMYMMETPELDLSCTDLSSATIPPDLATMHVELRTDETTLTANTDERAYIGTYSHVTGNFRLTGQDTEDAGPWGIMTVTTILTGTFSSGIVEQGQVSYNQSFSGIDGSCSGTTTLEGYQI